MAFVTPRMSLKVWNAASDPYDHEQLADNFLKLDQHDHSPGRGTPIGGAGIQPGAITSTHVYPGALGADSLGTGSITEDKLANGAVTSPKISSAVLASLGLSDGAIIRQGKSIVPTEETRAVATLGSLTTADQVQVTLATEGLIYVVFMAEIKETVADAGIVELRLDTGGFAGPANGLQANGTAINVYGGVITSDMFSGVGGGLHFVNTMASATQQPAMVHAVRATAGVRTVSVAYGATTGTIFAKNRRLWVWTRGF